MIKLDQQVTDKKENSQIPFKTTRWIVIIIKILVTLLIIFLIFCDVFVDYSCYDLIQFHNYNWWNDFANVDELSHKKIQNIHAATYQELSTFYSNKSRILLYYFDIIIAGTCACCFAAGLLVGWTLGRFFK